MNASYLLYIGRLNDRLCPLGLSALTSVYRWLYQSIPHFLKFSPTFKGQRELNKCLSTAYPCFVSPPGHHKEGCTCGGIWSHWCKWSKGLAHSRWALAPRPARRSLEEASISTPWSRHRAVFKPKSAAQYWRVRARASMQWKGVTSWQGVKHQILTRVNTQQKRVYKIQNWFRIVGLHGQKNIFYSILGCVLPLREVALR